MLYIGAKVYIGTLVPVADILHPHSTRDNLQLVAHPRRDINYKTRPQALQVHVFTIRLVIVIHPRQERRRYNEWSQTFEDAAQADDALYGDEPPPSFHDALLAPVVGSRSEISLAGSVGQFLFRPAR